MRRNRPSRRPQAPPRGARRAWSLWPHVVIPTVVAAVIVALGAVLSMLLQGEGTSSLPAYIQNASPNVRAAYAYAVEYPEVLQYIPCYCGCGKQAGHGSVHDCFVQSGQPPGGPVVFDSHGANCGLCVETALSAQRLMQQGNTLREAREYVDLRFGGIGPGTDTPPIP